MDDSSIGVYRSSDSRLIGTYEYDLWGRPISVKEASSGIDTNDILKKNPFRYRGYYYDNETGFYYLNARYYDPGVRRFISADSIGVLSIAPMGLTDKNLYSYCDCNPINRVDSTGQFWSGIFEFAKVAIAEIGRTLTRLAPAYAGCGGLAMADGLLPIGDTIAVTGIMLLTVGAIGYSIYQTIEYSCVYKTKAEAKEKVKATTIEKTKDTRCKLIYRYGATNIKNLYQQKLIKKPNRAYHSQ